MSFLSVYQNNIVLLDGPMETRLKYDYKIALNDDFAIYHLIYNAKASECLEELYRGDIAVAQKYELPILLNIPTYRASEKYMSLHGFNKHAVTKINQDCFDFVASIKASIGYQNVFIMGPVGPKNDAYDASLALSVSESQAYHQSQIQALARAGVDLISIVTMPSLAEALGCAQAAADTIVPYIVGFVVDQNAKLLDGTDLHVAIREIDCQAAVKPLCYIFSCTHPSIAKHVLQNYYPEYDRIKGIKANGSCKSPTELEQANCALADPADQFGREVVELAKKYKWHLMGGCCGTNDQHLAAIAERIQQK